MGTSRRDMLRMLLGPVAAPFRAPPIALDTGACLAWGGTLCTFCGDACPESAIRFRGGRRPVIDREACTLCGDCVPVCPVRAITLARDSREQGETTWD